MKVMIEDGVLVVETENAKETEVMQDWRAAWAKDHIKDSLESKKEKWFKCLYYNPCRVLVI